MVEITEQVGKLAADVIGLNHRNETAYHHSEDNQTGHGLRKQAISSVLSALRSHEMIRDGYPNYERFGFVSQAFIDITLDLKKDGITEKDIRKRISENIHVILIYTVFGDVDLRCKVVGFDAREIEQVAMYIKGLEGVQSSRTSMVIDETDPEKWRDRAADLIRSNAIRVGEAIQRKRSTKAPP